MDANYTDVSSIADRLNSSVAEEVRSYISRENITQSEFAHRLGVSKGQVSKLINAPTDTKLSTIINLATVMGKEPMLVFTDGRRDVYRYPDDALTILKEPEIPTGRRVTD